MEEFDYAMAQRVWRRVRGQDATPVPEGLPVLLRQNAAVYRFAAGKSRGAVSRRLWLLYRQTQESMADLEKIPGIIGEAPRLPAVQMPLRQALMQALDREGQLWQEFCGRAGNSPQGEVFARLAAQAHNRRGMLAEMLRKNR